RPVRPDPHAHAADGPDEHLATHQDGHRPRQGGHVPAGGDDSEAEDRHRAQEDAEGAGGGAEEEAEEGKMTCMDDVRHEYRHLKNGGASPHEVYRRVMADGAGEIEAIRTIRVLYGLDLREAKEVMVQAEGWGASLSKHQARFVEPAERLLAERESG